MTGRISACVLLAFRVPRRQVESLVPAGLELVTHGDWAFWNVVASRIEAMRPAGLPAWCGLSYHHVAYRLYVRAQNINPSAEGLFFVRSDADQTLIAMTGNWLSDFRFHRSQIAFSATPTEVSLQVRSPEAAAELHAAPAFAASDVPVADSCFSSRAEAVKFLKYRPLGLAPAAGVVRLAEVFRNEAEWHEAPLTLRSARFQFLNQFGPHQLELATLVTPLDYRWRLGKRLNTHS